MARSRTVLKPQEVSAIHSAVIEWNKWKRVDDQTHRQVSTDDLADLKAATKRQQAEVGRLLGPAGQSDLAALLSSLQELENFQHGQDKYRLAIEDMFSTLVLLSAGLEQIVQRGGKIDKQVRRWVCLAADQWVAAGNPNPTAAGRFFRALQDVPSDRGLPGVTRERVDLALKHWRRARNTSV